MLRYTTDRASWTWFSHLLQHPARKLSRSILRNPEPARGWRDLAPVYTIPKIIAKMHGRMNHINRNRPSLLQPTSVLYHRRTGLYSLQKLVAGFQSISLNEAPSSIVTSRSLTEHNRNRHDAKHLFAMLMITVKQCKLKLFFTLLLLEVGSAWMLLYSALKWHTSCHRVNNPLIISLSQNVRSRCCNSAVEPMNSDKGSPVAIPRADLYKLTVAKISPMCQTSPTLQVRHNTEMDLG